MQSITWTGGFDSLLNNGLARNTFIGLWQGAGPGGSAGGNDQLNQVRIYEIISTSAVPEPSTSLLAAISGLALVARSKPKST